MPALLVKYADGAKTVELPEGRPLYVGRDPACDIVAPSPLVSRRHAVFISKGGLSGIKDLDSNNGTLVNGEQLFGSRALADGDVVQMHGLHIRYSRDNRADRPPMPAPATLLETPRRQKQTCPETDTQYLPPPEGLAGLLNDTHPPSPHISETVRISPPPPPPPAEAATFPVDTIQSLPVPLPGGWQAIWGEGEFCSNPGVSREDGLEDLPVSPGLRRAMRRRFRLFRRLDELADERRLLRLRAGGLPTEVEVELLRQDGELELLPATAQANTLLDELLERMAGGEAADPLMRKALEIGVEQARLCRDFTLAETPRVFWEAYQIVADEPLAVALSEAGIYHVDLLGGTAYLIALSGVEREKAAVSAAGGDDVGRAPSPVNENTAGDALAEPLGDVDIARETAALLRQLPERFWRVYTDAAAHFLTRPAPPPPAVRAFLRFGALGLKRWWLRDDVRDFIQASCADEASRRLPRGLRVTPVVYLDEYLEAVLDMECPPYAEDSPTDEASDRQAVQSARAWKKLSTLRSYRFLLAELLPELRRRSAELGRSGRELDDKIRALESIAGGERSAVYDLMKRRQAVNASLEALMTNMETIEGMTTGELLEMEKEVEGRFRAGRYARPRPEAIVRTECEAVRALCAGLSGKKPAFLPQCLREGFMREQDDVTSRRLAESDIAAVERLDPALFSKTVITSRRRSHRVSMRLAPLVVIVPFVGSGGQCRRAREGMDGGLLFLPLRLADPHHRGQILRQILADYRWESSVNEAGGGLIGSDTLAGRFLEVKRDWRSYGRQRRERGLVHTDISDKLNWRKVYEVYLTDADKGAEKLFARNQDLYAALVGNHLELPDGVKPFTVQSV